jgi:uncharacterized protein
MNDNAPTNHLASETSPYLLQHVHNPVDWYPWNDTALALARERDKPILLSIGYSACHWCHVMAHESFEDAETAALMNRLFINIKVDREERPDLDRVYQLAHQIMVQRGGGWPLTLFLSPDDLTPFFAGTYFPKTPRYGSPSFREVLTRVAAFYSGHKDELRRQNAALQDVFKRIQQTTVTSTDQLNDAPLLAAYRSLSTSFDTHFGGFGRAPKFPHPSSLEFLLWQACDAQIDPETGKQSREMLLTTLTRMAQGGIHDQLGGGFSRYSVDEQWLIPHFEKMLYDNGPLLALYAQSATLTNNPLYLGTARGIAQWTMHEMQSPDGGYWSSLDADSEGHEGKYYVWTREQARAALDETEYTAFAARYGLDQPANFEGHWQLHIETDIKTIAATLGKSEADIERLLDSARDKLLTVRQRRVRPGLDDKVLTAWNGLMIRGMAIAGRLLDVPQYLSSARRAIDFVRDHLWQDGHLFASWREGQARLPAYLDDYACLLDGVLEMLQTKWESELFEFAPQLADALLLHFEDRQQGGFWFTADDRPVPLHRSKTFTDDSLPAGNAVAARALLTLGHLGAEPRYLEAAERTLKAAMSGMSQYADAHAAMLLALKNALEPSTMVILRGDENKLWEWRKVLERQFDPRRILLAIPADAANLTGLLAQCTPRGEICAYICRGTECSLPVTEIDRLPGLAV